MPTERDIRLVNRKVSSVGVGEAYKGKELGKNLGKVEVMVNPVGDGDRQQPMVLQDLFKEGAAKEDQKG